MAKGAKKAMRRAAEKAAAQAMRQIRLSDPAARWYWDSHANYAGQNVTVDTALTLPTFWACTRLISETISTLPIGVYERASDGGRRLAREHDLYALVHERPNYDMTACEFWEAKVASLCLRGNGYSKKMRASGGRVVALELMPSERVQPMRNEDGDIVYRYSGPAGTEILAQDDVLHVKGFGSDGLVGLSPIAYARHSIGLAHGMERAAGTMFANGLQAGGVLKTDKVLDKEQRKLVREGLVEQVGGAGKRGGLIVLEGGFDYKSISLPPEEAQMLESRSFAVEDICRWFRVPPILIGHGDKQSSWPTSTEQQMILFLTFTLRPYLTRIEQAINRSLILPADRGKIFAEFNLDGLLRADTAARGEFMAKMVQNGIYDRNEFREKENLPRREGAGELTAQVNLMPLSQLGKTHGTTTP